MAQDASGKQIGDNEGALIIGSSFHRPCQFQCSDVDLGAGHAISLRVDLTFALNYVKCFYAAYEFAESTGFTSYLVFVASLVSRVASRHAGFVKTHRLAAALC